MVVQTAVTWLALDLPSSRGYEREAISRLTRQLIDFVSLNDGIYGFYGKMSVVFSKSKHFTLCSIGQACRTLSISVRHEKKGKRLVSRKGNLES